MQSTVIKPLSAAQLVGVYHQRTKHHVQRFAAGPETLDWSDQPDPFRSFPDSPRIYLPLAAHCLHTRFADLYTPERVPSLPLTINTLSCLLELSFGLSAWKEYGPDRWALRCNPSSGNLHPTEAYVITQAVPGIDNGLYHYHAATHGLELRSTDSQMANSGSAQLLLGLSSIHWREAWKYGERAFRYCQLDIGHALGTLRHAAAALGWSITTLDADHNEMTHLLGLDRDADYGAAEREDAEVLLRISPRADTLSDSLRSSMSDPMVNSTWHGHANRLDAHPMYHWPIIDEVAAATEMPHDQIDRCTNTHTAAASHSIYATGSTAVDIIRGRRSAQAYHPDHCMRRDELIQLLRALMPETATPAGLWNEAAHTHLLLFINQVEDLAPGLYLLLRDTQAEASLRATLRTDFSWEATKLDDALPLYRLYAGDHRQLARALSCRQGLASDSCVTVVMISEFAVLIADAPWRYRQLFRECGLIGQSLYLGAEALGLRGTGIGCYFDDAVHELLGITSHHWQVLYHFTVGLPLLDTRITTTAPYADRHALQQLHQPTDTLESMR